MKSPFLPQAVANYFTADTIDGESVARCFTENGVVQDEGHTYRGRDEIQRWKTAASAKYQYTCEPIRCEEKEGKTIVTSHLVGNFPGSPVDLHYFFTIEGDKIATLQVTP